MQNTAHFVFGIFGNATALFLFLVLMITFWRIIKSKSTEQFSGIPYAMTLMNCLLSAWYGLPLVSKNNLLVSTINGTGAGIKVIYVLIFIVYAPKKEKTKILGLFAFVLTFFAAVVLISLLALHGNTRKLFCGFATAVFSIIMYGSPLSIMGCDAGALSLFCTLTLLLWLNIVETRPFVPEDTRAVNPWVPTESSYRLNFKDYEVLLRLKASAKKHLRVFALEIVEGSDGAREGVSLQLEYQRSQETVFALEIVEGSDGAKEDVSIQLEYQRSQETSISRCREEHMLNFRGNRGGSDRDQGGGEEEEGRNGGRGNGSGRQHGGGGGGGGGGGDGGGGGGGGGGEEEGSDVEGRGGDKKKLRPTPEILQLLAVSTIANTAQTLGSAISLKNGGLTFLTKILLILDMAISLAGYLCSIIAILLMPKRPRFSRVLVWTGCAVTTLGFLMLIVAFVLEL